MTIAVAPVLPKRARMVWWKMTTLAFVALVVIATLAGSSQSFQDCVHDRKNRQPYQALHKKGPLFVKTITRLELHATCVRVSAAENDAAIAAIATIVVAFFTFTLWCATTRLWQSAEDQLDEFRRSLAIAEQHAGHMADSVTQAIRAASAMEDVASSMNTNVEKLKETVEIAKANGVISGRIADQQEKIGKLQTRAYLTVAYAGLVPQNNATMYRYEPRMQLSSTGLTPAYKVRYRAASDVLPYPLPADFAFPLPTSEPAGGTGLLGPRNNFTLSAPAPRMYSDVEIAEVKNGSRRRIYIWGIVEYEDAFGEERFLKFAQSIMWPADGTNNTTGFNTTHHNDAN